VIFNGFERSSALHLAVAITAKIESNSKSSAGSGTYTIQAWHELYGPLTSSVRVEAGGSAADVDFTYSGEEKPKLH
jgi:hypothetical protein